MLAGLGKVDDFLGDYADDGVRSIRKPKGCNRRFERDAHDALSLGVEVR
jgi:hypothetical protein